MGIGSRTSATLLFALTPFAAFPGAAFGQAAPAPPRQDAPVTVTNSPGARTTTTFNDNRVIIYEEARRDPLTQQFVATLRNFNRFAGEEVQMWQRLPIHLFALNESATGGGSNEAGRFYFFLVAPLSNDIPDLAEHIDRCEVQPGISAIGFIGSVATDTSDAALRVRLMTREEGSMLHQVCDGLRQSASTLRQDARQPGSTATVFDHVSGRNGFVALLILSGGSRPQSFEMGRIRDYWATALASRYTRLPMPNPTLSLALVDQLEHYEDGRWIDIPIRLPLSFSNSSSYPPRAREEFGSRIDRLEADWSAYLARAAMTLRGERRPLIVNGRWASLMPHFTKSQVGSPEFWLAINDLRSFGEQLDCITKHFLVDRGYVAPDEYVAPGRCALDEIRMR